MQIPNSYGDRFIPGRFFGEKFRSFSLSNSNYNGEHKNDILCIKTEPFYWRQHNYRINIKMQLGLNVSGRCLNFHDATTQENCDRTFNMKSENIKFDERNRNLAYTENHPVESALKNIVSLTFNPNGLLDLGVRHLTSSLLQICEMKDSYFQKKIAPKQWHVNRYGVHVFHSGNENNSSFQQSFHRYRQY